MIDPRVDRLRYQTPENRICFDCGVAIEPRFFSVNNSIFLCMDCAGFHRRKIYVGFSLLRVLPLDTLTPVQINILEIGGNARAMEFYREHGIDNLTGVGKYNNRFAAEYRQLLRDRSNYDSLPEHA